MNFEWLIHNFQLLIFRTTKASARKNTPRKKSTNTLVGNGLENVPSFGSMPLFHMLLFVQNRQNSSFRLYSSDDMTSNAHRIGLKEVAHCPISRTRAAFQMVSKLGLNPASIKSIKLTKTAAICAVLWGSATDRNRPLPKAA